MNESNQPIALSESNQDTKNISVIALESASADAIGSAIRSLGFSENRFASIDEFFNATELVSPSCIVLCAGNHSAAALDFQTKISSQCACGASTIVIADVEIRDAVKLMEKGALTVLSSQFDASEVGEYLKIAVEKDRESEGVRKRLQELESYRNSLSDRQLKILNMVEQGHSNRQIANWFDLSQRTIELERARLMSAFQSASLAQLVSKWTELRVLSKKWHQTDQQSDQADGQVLDA